MGRRRWRFITIASCLLFIIKDTQCQDENDFYYNPVERSFAQVQPPLFPNSRPTTFFEHGDNFRVASSPSQPLYNEGHVRFPNPNYNQNPTPFQLPSGRSQAGTQYYLNQPEFGTPQRQRFRPALPFNYQLIHPASTKRPDVSQIHSVAYQNDPSKPETFLGQITINNPDIDYLRNSRFKTIPFDGNSLKSNGQSGHISRDEDIDNDNQDLFEHHKVTTYNPNKLVSKQRLSNKPSSTRFTSLDTVPLDDKTNFRNIPSKALYGSNNKPTKPNASLYQSSSTEYKALLDIEPLLEDDISDISSFRELMKSKKGSFDVEVIKSNNSELELDQVDDSKPDASSMNMDNVSKDKPIVIAHTTSSTTLTTTKITTTEANIHDENASEEVEDEGEYEYYDETESPPAKHTTEIPHSTEHVTDIYDEYDSTEEVENTTDESKINSTEFDILPMKPEKTMVKDDNFKHFVDTTIIDQLEKNDNVTTVTSIDTTISNEDVISDEEVSSIEIPSILGQEVVSVVTTKSVVNGTISIPDYTFAPTTAKVSTTDLSSSTEESQSNETSSVTTENWIVVASVQTSRSVSGARFLPFPAVEHEDKKQVLSDEQDEEVNHDDEDDLVTKNPKLDRGGLVSSSSSTENINDKLDSIQSELSSDVLSGSIDKENKNIELITEATTEPSTSPPTTTTQSLNVFTLKSTQTPLETERSSPDPLPVTIKKFTPRVTTSTTPKPKKKLVTVMDDLSGLLPAGYKPRLSFKDKRTSTTTTTTTSTTTTTITPSTTTSEDTVINGTQARSSGISTKNRVIILDDKSLLPKEYKPKEHRPQDDLLKKFQKDEISKFLPPGYKPSSSEAPEIKQTPKSILDKVQQVDISAFLPKGFKLNVSTTEKPVMKHEPIPKILPVSDISAFLPPGFKLNSTEKEITESPILTNIKIADISNLLPPGFKVNDSEEQFASQPAISSTTKAPGGIKLVFPSRPGGKATRKTTPKPVAEMGPSPVTPKIQKGWPTRASTEFTGWPSPSTTPFSIEKLLEAQRNATATSPMPEFSTEATTRRTTTTTTTTPAPPPSTTPGICRKECDIEATIKIVAGAKWVPELLDHNTAEWKALAKDMREELNSVYSKSDILKKWYRNVRIDGFSEGSILVDYTIELKDVEDKIDTLDLKKMFHRSLHEAKPGSVVEVVDKEPSDEFDLNQMQGDQPEEDRLNESDENVTKTIDKSAGKLEIGKFVMDPAYTEFSVSQKREELPRDEEIDTAGVPQWGIAVIVIALASLLFVIIFGVTVLVNRQKSVKTKQPIPLSEDMLRELDKSHMGGFDDMHQLKDRELPYLPSGKRMSSAFIEQLAYPNPGDSWRSEWTPQLQKYMQHYTPDSGRGSQTYGPVGNGYGYGGGGSQLYGQTGGGSQLYGYTGEYPRSHYSRRRSEYDSNF